MRLTSRHFLLTVALCLLAACAQVGIPTPQTFNERLAVGYAAVTTIRDTATTLVTASKITPAEAQNVQDQADRGRTALDIARATAKTDLSSADTRLTATLQLLTALQSYLAAKGTK